MAVNGDDDQGPQGQEPQIFAGPIEASQGLRFPCPERFNGSEEQFEDFAYSLRAYL